MNRAQKRATDAMLRRDLNQSAKEFAAFKRKASKVTGIPVAHMGIIARGGDLMVIDNRQPWEKLDAALAEAGYEPDAVTELSADPEETGGAA